MFQEKSLEVVAVGEVEEAVEVEVVELDANLLLFGFFIKLTCDGGNLPPFIYLDDAVVDADPDVIVGNTISQFVYLAPPFAVVES